MSSFLFRIKSYFGEFVHASCPCEKQCAQFPLEVYLEDASWCFTIPILEVYLEDASGCFTLQVQEIYCQTTKLVDTIPILKPKAAKLKKFESETCHNAKMKHKNQK